jgi:hypothetical protein
MTPPKLTKSEAKKAYWAKIPKETRSEKARKMAKTKAKKMTPKQRSAHGKMMRAAKDKK